MARLWAIIDTQERTPTLLLYGTVAELNQLLSDK